MVDLMGDQFSSDRAVSTAPRRPQRRRTRPSTHPTAVLLLDTAVALLDEDVPISGLTIPLILERSGVSYGSLYHFYEDISDLVEQAIVFRYTRRLKVDVERVRALLDSSDAVGFRQRTEQLIEASASPERRTNRLDRLESLGARHGRPRLVERIAKAQQEITDDQAAVLRELQERGWLRRDVDPVALSAFIQAVMFGRVVDDVAERPTDREPWRDLVLRALRAVLFPDD